MDKMEVIDLDSDDDDKKKSKGTKKNVCINLKCDSGVNMKTASSFACSYYGLNQAKKKKRFICEKCFVVAIQHQEMLAEAFFKREPLLKCELPDHTMQIDLSDSDSEDEGPEGADGDDYLPEGVLLDMELKIESALSNVIEKYDVKYQVTESHKILQSQYDEIDRSNAECERDIKEMISKMDTIRNSLYDQFRPNIKLLADLTIDDSPVPALPPAPPPLRPIQRPEIPSHPTVATKKVTQIRIPPVPIKPQENQVEIMPVEKVDKYALGYGLPPHGQLIRRPAEVDNIVLVMKHPLMPWIKAKVHAILTHQPMSYRVKFLPKKYYNALRAVFGKQLAIHSPAPVIIPVSTRVVAIFNDVNSSNYYSGVIAEPPKSTNKYRYLVFFDDGYAQYVAHKHIFVVSESSPRVWEDIPIESRDFVKKYLETYPERPMVKLQVGQVVKTEWNGKWWVARVKQLDASLVQMSFDADKRTEWIYRGSSRLGPLYVELLKATARQQGHHITHNTPSHHRISGPGGKVNAPYVEYTSGITEPENEVTIKTEPQAKAPTPPTQARAVARKSTAKKPANEVQKYVPPAEAKSAHSIVYFQIPESIKHKTYVPHRCNSSCIEVNNFKVDDLKGYSPLSIPLLCGWNRQICKFPKGKKVVLYQAPCGLRLRSIEEVHHYLQTTKSTMSVDLFDFDNWVHCLAEFVLDKCFVNIKDLSYGVENVPIPCVNELDHALPDPITYSTVREPTEGVNLNLDPEFLCSCDCEDDCQDKEKCQCWQLTIQGATFGGRMPNINVGYHYKRLPEPVTTGIYECNSKCKCSVKTCLNRVVQHPLTLKLQVFKTAPRGWGIRCLNDIPLGSFICIYAGRLLTEQGANEGGKNYGDEYLAELDYVEVVENIKEGFESDVLEPEIPVEPPEEKPQEEEKSGRKKGSPECDADFDIRQYNSEYSRLDTETDVNMKKRLRKRKKSDEIVIQDVEDKSEDGSIGRSEDGSVDKNSNDNSQDNSDEEGKESGKRELSRFEPSLEPSIERPKFKSVRDFFGRDEAVYIMDAKTTGNIGRYLNHSCDPNVFVQNVFVDTHDVRFPWVAFFALTFIRAGQELTWNYSYDVGSIPGKVIICKCGASNCRGRLL